MTAPDDSCRALSAVGGEAVAWTNRLSDPTKISPIETPEFDIPLYASPQPANPWQTRAEAAEAELARLKAQPGVAGPLAIADKYLESVKRLQGNDFYANGVPMPLVVQQHQELRDEIAALAAPVSQEPVASVDGNRCVQWIANYVPDIGQNLYAAPVSQSANPAQVTGRSDFAQLPEFWQGYIEGLVEENKTLSDHIAASVSQEPVAWQYRQKSSGGVWSMWCTVPEDTAISMTSENRTDIQTRPLYASPQSITEGEPSDAEVDDIVQRCADFAREVIISDAHYKPRKGERKRTPDELAAYVYNSLVNMKSRRNALLAAKSKGGQADG